MYSIRTTLVFSFGAATLFGMLALSINIHDRAKKMLVASVIRDNEQTAAAQSQRIAEWLEGNEKELALLTEFDLVREFEPSRLQPMLMRRISTRKDLSGLFYVTPEGRAWSTLAPSDYRSVTSSDYFRLMMVEEKVPRFLSRAAIDSADGLPKVFLLRTIYTVNAKIVGLLGSGLRLDRLSELASWGPYEDSYGWLVDRDGKILAHPDQRLWLKSIQNKAETDIAGLAFLAQRMQNGKTGQGVITEQNGEKRFVVYTPVPGDSGWTYAISIPEQAITSQVNALLRSLSLTVGLTLLLLIGLIWFLSRRISKPIELLAQHTRRLSAGHLSERLQLARGTELELTTLARDINQMAENLDSMVNDLLESERQTAETNAELARHHKALLTSEARYQLAMDAGNDILWDVDLQNNSVVVSSRWETLYGVPAQTPQQWLRMLHKLLHPADWQEFKRKLRAHMIGRVLAFQHEFRLRMKDGEWRWRSCHGKSLRDETGRVIRLCGSLTDIHEQKLSEQKIKHMAFHDSLTGLPNRWLFMERLNLALANKKRAWQGALLFMNINRFKMLNDLYGHQEGDELLRQVAKRMDSLRQADSTFARLGGDEFVLLLPEVPTQDALQEVAEGMLRFIRAPLPTRQREYRLTASIGISLFPSDGYDPSELMRKADIALQAAKDSGRNDWCQFDPLMLEQIKRRNETELALRQALHNNEFSLQYQPQLTLSGKNICGFEALLRWTRPGFGPVSPAEFIPLAEESGLIIELGEWVLKTACSQLAAWRDLGHTDIRIAVNVSSLQLKQGFADHVARVLVQTGLPARALEVEITESVLMQSFSDHMIELESLREMGVRIALDDFGTGYSSLSYLRQLPIHVVKIDKSFVDDLIDNPTTRHITESIISLSHGLGLEVIAEGVECRKQMDLLEYAGCEMVQGYYIDRPLPAAAASELLDKRDKIPLV